jgi:hypothetical protein
VLSLGCGLQKYTCSLDKAKYVFSEFKVYEARENTKEVIITEMITEIEARMLSLIHLSSKYSLNSYFQP